MVFTYELSDLGMLLQDLAGTEPMWLLFMGMNKIGSL
jgi:hypothetical protein